LINLNIKYEDYLPHWLIVNPLGVHRRDARVEVEVKVVEMEVEVEVAQYSRNFPSRLPDFRPELNSISLSPSNVVGWICSPA